MNWPVRRDPTLQVLVTLLLVPSPHTGRRGGPLENLRPPEAVSWCVDVTPKRKKKVISLHGNLGPCRGQGRFWSRFPTAPHPSSYTRKTSKLETGPSTTYNLQVILDLRLLVVYGVLFPGWGLCPVSILRCSGGRLPGREEEGNSPFRVEVVVFF